MFSLRSGSLPCNDPYDLWASSFGGLVKERYYSGSIAGKIGAVGLGLADWLFPNMIRKLVLTKKNVYPINIGHEALIRDTLSKLDEASGKIILHHLTTEAAYPNGDPSWSWGLGFPWMSKNGLYESHVPFVTHTPYVMEALLVLKHHKEALLMFHSTWQFLESLKVMYEEGEELALSYAPVNEPRIVVNANGYAAFAYALHAIYGDDEVHGSAKDKVRRIINWVVNQQNEDGAWYYYADVEPGNFIDCFHSCFVLKNLLKVRRLMPELSELVNSRIDNGWRFVRENFYDRKSGLCRRFIERDIRDPFRWDLYDQAEYLGLLVDFGLLNEADQFARHVEKKFKKGKNWYCRIDIFGRRWGKNFMRWGIVPYLYHRARLTQKHTGTEQFRQR